MNSLPDPGWGRPRDVLKAAALPHHALRRRGANILLGARSVFAAIMILLALLSVVAVIVFTGQHAEDDLSPAVTSIVAGIAGAASVAGSLLTSRELACESGTELAEAYRVRFFQRLAFAMSAGLFGWMGAIFSGSVLPFFVGLVPNLVGLTLLAPTQAHLQKDQEALNAQGCDLSLSDHLQTTLSP